MTRYLIIIIGLILTSCGNVNNDTNELNNYTQYSSKIDVLKKSLEFTTISKATFYGKNISSSNENYINDSIMNIESSWKPKIDTANNKIEYLRQTKIEIIDALNLKLDTVYSIPSDRIRIQTTLFGLYSNVEKYEITNGEI